MDYTCRFSIEVGGGGFMRSVLCRRVLWMMTYVGYTVDVSATAKNDLDTRLPSLLHGRVKYGQAFLKN